jgi:hypothetical protein
MPTGFGLVGLTPWVNCCDVVAGPLVTCARRQTDRDHVTSLPHSKVLACSGPPIS